MRILNAEPENYCADARRILQDAGELVEESVSQEELATRVRGFDALIVRVGLRVTRSVLEAAPALKVVTTATTGLDHIDLEAAHQHGTAILSLQGERAFLRSVPATAEHTWALLLALVRGLPWAFDDVRNGGWSRDRFVGHELRDKRLGIIGLGRIGQQVATYALAFGMEVGAYDVDFDTAAIDVRRFHVLDDLLRWSQVLSVHLPLTNLTQGTLNEARLRLLPRGAWVINTSRGAIVDETALTALLRERHLAGAAVDVLAREQPNGARANSPLLQYASTYPNLLITPHLGGATVESMRKTELFMAQRLRRFLQHPQA